MRHRDLGGWTNPGHFAEYLHNLYTAQPGSGMQAACNVCPGSESAKKENEKGEMNLKFLHLSDLHLGKRLNEHSLDEDQKYILDQILETARAEQPDGVLIAGDIYDKSMPSAEAVRLFDDFLTGLVGDLGLKTFVISGNHDSPERVAYAGRILSRAGLYVSPVFHGVPTPITLEDEFGTLDLYLLPFIKPATARPFLEEEFQTYTDMMDVVIRNMQVDPERRNVLVAHQFVTGAARSDSEEVNVGGLDDVSARVFDPFDYVALGHIHGPQNVGDPRIRYCGTPLKYSFSEIKHQKSVSVVELRKKGELEVRKIPLKPLRDLQEIRGEFNSLMERSFWSQYNREDYFRVILTNEQDVFDVAAKLRTVYPNLMNVEYDNLRTRTSSTVEDIPEDDTGDPLTLFQKLYLAQNGAPMTEEQTAFCLELIEKLWEADV